MNLVILDRDGVINEDSKGYIKSPAEWKPIPGSLEAIARLNRAGYRVVVATNQSGIARGLLDLDMLIRIHEKMNHAIAEAGGVIDAVFFCPHGPESMCACRKPRPGMFHDIARRLQLELTGVPAIGDSLRDLQVAEATGAKPVLVRTGKGEQTLEELGGIQGLLVFDDLARAVDAVVDGRI
jgi:D-glycero-D-manno-heptose 1,7-bisphosphate phosphatase